MDSNRPLLCAMVKEGNGTIVTFCIQWMVSSVSDIDSGFSPHQTARIVPLGDLFLETLPHPSHLSEDGNPEHPCLDAGYVISHKAWIVSSV